MATTIVQDPTNINISVIAAENPLALIILLLKAELIDNNNINNYNSIDWK